MLPGPLAAETTLGGGTTVAQGVFLEMFLTAELVFTIIMLAAEKHKSTFIAPVRSLRASGKGNMLMLMAFAGRHRLIAFHRRADWSILHGRPSEPRSILWSCSSKPSLPDLPLDLLGRANDGVSGCRRFLQVHQGPRI
jgi:hypothetical protein